MRVLVVEDDPHMLGLLRETLEADGFDVTDCPDALHWLRFHSGEAADNDSGFDLVISDVRMPGVTGFDVLYGIRCHTRNPPPVILITAFVDEQTHEKARELGAAATIDKPFAMQTLLSVARSTIRDPP